MPTLQERLDAARSKPPDLQGRLDAARGQSVPFGATPPGVQTTPILPEGGLTESVEQATKLADPLLQGMTFGFGDEITGAIRAPFIDETLGESIQQVRDRSADIREEIGPGGFFATEMAGALIPASRLGPAALAAPGIRSLPSLARFGLTGAGAGAVSGAGTTEGGLAERAEGAATGAALGGALGVTLPLAGKAAARVLQPVISRMSGAGQQAIVRIQRALARDEMTPAQAAVRLRQLGVNATVADAGGENVRGVARGVQSVPGRGRDLARDVLTTRQEGQTARLSETVNRELGVTETFRQSLDDRIIARRESARPLYEAAYANDVPFTVELQALFNRPAIKQAWGRAQTIAGNEGRELPQVFVQDAAGNLTLDVKTAPTMETIDFIKRGLDDIVERSRNAITGAIEGDVARGVASSRRALLELVDGINPDYKAARAVYAGESASIDALRQGRRLGGSLSRKGDEAFDPEQILNDLDRMNEAEKTFFRQGLARGLIDVIEATPDRADAVKRLIGTEAKRGRLRAAFPDAETFNRFMFDLSREARFFETGTEVLGNSVTGRLLADQADLLSDEAAAQLLQGNTGTATANILSRVINRIRRPSPAVADELSRLIFAQGPAAESALARVAATPGIPPALQRSGIAALIESERQIGANR